MTTQKMERSRILAMYQPLVMQALFWQAFLKLVPSSSIMIGIAKIQRRKK